MLKLLLALSLISVPVIAGSALFVDQVDPYIYWNPVMNFSIGSGVGLPEAPNFASDWTHFTADLYNAFGGSSNVTISSDVLPALGGMSGYSALLINARTPGGPNDVLDSAEITTLKAFIATGRPVVLIGENAYWTNWNNSILSAVGGSYSFSSKPDVTATDTPLIHDALTAGVASIAWMADGQAIGGTSLFQHNVATLWAPNVLSLLSLNVEGDADPPLNPQFDANVASFLASDPSAVAAPEAPAFRFCVLGFFGISLFLAGRGYFDPRRESLLRRYMLSRA